MPRKKTTREEAVLGVAEMFRRHGYDGASLQIISDATGLGRASLYHHFPGGKEQMARAVFEAVAKAVEAELLRPLREPGPPRARLERWVEGVERLYSGGKKSCLLGAMVLGGGSDLFSEELERAFRSLLDGLVALLREGGLGAAEARRRAARALSVVQGSLILSRGLRDPSTFLRAVRELPEELLSK